MLNVEESIKEYIKKRTVETRDGIRVPLSYIAEELDYSTATVWRAIQKLKGRRIIKIVKSRNKTEPDKIYYVGEENTMIDTIDDLIEKTGGILLVLRELRDRTKEAEDVIFELTKGRNN